MRPGVKFLRSVFEVTHVEFQAYDISNHKLLFSSGVVCKLLGYSKAEYFNMSTDFYKSIVHPDDFNKVQQTIEDIPKAKAGDVIEMTARARKRDGNYIWLYSRQMIYEKDRNCHTCTIIREVEDVTRLMELEGELEEKVKQLRIVSFKNSHLLRSPVASIIGLVGLIEESGVTGEHNKQILHFLKEAITKLDEIIHEINNEIRLK